MIRQSLVCALVSVCEYCCVLNTLLRVAVAVSGVRCAVCGVRCVLPWRGSVPVQLIISGHVSSLGHTHGEAAISATYCQTRTSARNTPVEMKTIFFF
jgi:hypothetical protein